MCQVYVWYSAVITCQSVFILGVKNYQSRSLQHSFVEIEYEIFSMVILSLQLIQEGQLSVSIDRICTGQSLPSKRVVR